MLNGHFVVASYLSTCKFSYTGRSILLNLPNHLLCIIFRLLYKMNADDIIQKFYEKLVKYLPMDDVQFRASLRTVGLLPGNLKKTVMSKPTRAEMAEYFLDDGINDDMESFSKLLTVMKNSKHKQLKVLEIEIQSEKG